MDYKVKLNKLHSILESFSDQITYTKEKDFFILECSNVNSKNHKDLTLKLKINYSDMMLNEMAWGYSADFGATENKYITRKDALDTIAQSIAQILDKEMFDSESLKSLPTNEAKNNVYMNVLNEIESLGLSKWRVEFMMPENDYLLLPIGPNLGDYKLTIEKMRDFDALKMLELKQALKDDLAFHEALRIQDVLKRLL